MFREMRKKKEKSDQNVVAELTREWLYKENKWLWEENKKLKEDREKINSAIWDLVRENRKLKAQIEKMSWIWLASAAPMVINKEVKYKPWFKNWMPTYDGSDLFI